MRGGGGNVLLNCTSEFLHADNEKIHAHTIVKDRLVVTHTYTHTCTLTQTILAASMGPYRSGCSFLLYHERPKSESAVLVRVSSFVLSPAGQERWLATWLWLAIPSDYWLGSWEHHRVCRPPSGLSSHGGTRASVVHLSHTAPSGAGTVEVLS